MVIHSHAVEIFDINKSINCKQNDLILKKFGNVFMAKTGLSWNTCDIFDKREKYAIYLVILTIVCFKTKMEIITKLYSLNHKI